MTLRRLPLVLVPIMLATLEPTSRAEAPAPFTASISRLSKKGPRLVLARRESNLAVLRIQFRSGSLDDAHRPGLTKLTQFALLGASTTSDYEALRVELFRASATLDIETGVRDSAITLTAPKKQFERLAKKILELCLAPRLDPEALADAKTRALEADPRTDIGGIVSMLARAVMSDPAYGNDPEGDDETIRVLETRDVLRHLTGPMSPVNATVIVTGAFKPTNLLPVLARFSGGAKASVAKTEPELAGHYHLKSPLEVEVVAYPILFETPRAVAAAQLASALLGDRVSWRFRKLGLAAATITTPVHREWLDGILIALPTRSDQATPISALLDETVEHVRSGAFTEGELEDSRRFLLSRLRAVDRDPVALARELAMGGPDVAWISPEVVEELSRITKAELMAAVGANIVASRSIHVQLSPNAASGQARSVR